MGKSKPKAKPKKKAFESDDEDDFIKDSPSPPKKKATKKLKNFQDDSDDDAFGLATKKAVPKKAKAPAKKAAKKKSSFDDDSEDEKPKKASKNFSDSGSGEEFDLSNVAPARDRPGREKKTINYNFGGSDEDSDY